jgi:hypothetical protein
MVRNLLGELTGECPSFPPISQSTKKPGRFPASKGSDGWRLGISSSQPYFLNCHIKSVILGSYFKLKIMKPEQQSVEWCVETTEALVGKGCPVGLWLWPQEFLFILSS